MKLHIAKMGPQPIDCPDSVFDRIICERAPDDTPDSGHHGHACVAGSTAVGARAVQVGFSPRSFCARRARP